MGNRFKILLVIIFSLFLFSCNEPKPSIVDEFVKTELIVNGHRYFNSSNIVNTEFLELRERFIRYIENEDKEIEQESLIDEIISFRLELYEIREIIERWETLSGY